MRRLAPILIAAVIMTCSLSAVARENLTQDEKVDKGWVVSGISYGSDDTILVLNVKAVISAVPGEVWGLLSDISGWSSWMPILIRGYAIDGGRLPAPLEKGQELYEAVSSLSPVSAEVSDTGSTVVTTFEEYDLPFSKDWVISRYVFDATGASEGVYNVSWKQLFYGAEGRGGRWKISKYGGEGGDSLFEYHLRVKRSDSVPKKIFEVMVTNTADRFVRAIRRSVQSGAIEQPLPEAPADAQKTARRRYWWE